MASKTSNPAEYDLNAQQIARAACEVWSLGMAALTLLSELRQMRKYVFYFCNSIYVYIVQHRAILFNAQTFQTMLLNMQIKILEKKR